MASVPAGTLPAAVTTKPGQGHNRDCPAWGDDVLTMDLPSPAQVWADCQTTKAASSKHPGTAQARMRSTRRRGAFMALMVPQPPSRQAWRGVRGGWQFPSRTAHAALCCHPAGRHPDLLPGSRIGESSPYYPACGNTATGLTASLASNGPLHPRGRNAWGLGAWQMHRHYPRRLVNGQCQLLEPRLALNLRVVLPQWRTTASAASGLRRWWQQAQRQILTHELEHHRPSHQAAAHAQHQRQQLPAADNCALLDRQAQTILRQASQQARQASLQFDLAGDYGARDGPGLQP